MCEKNITPIQADSKEIINTTQKVAEFMEFANWFATPRRFRAIKTQKDFAASIGIHQDTLTDWKRRPEFWPLMQKTIQYWCQENIPDVIGGLFNNASKEGKAKDVEMCLRLSGLINKPNK